MRYIIIEDELIAANRLKKLIGALRPDYKHVLTVDSIESACISLPVLKFDLAFLDIQLADGLSFEIFDQIAMKKPVIFITAYNQYAIKAFKTNSIDYLLKPLDQEDLEQAIVKFEEYQVAKKIPDPTIDLKKLLSELTPKKIEKVFKKRFVIKIGEHLKTIEADDINMFYSMEKTTYILNKEGKQFIVDYSLERLEEILDDSLFYRVSRKYIINYKSITDMVSYSNSRLKLVIEKSNDEGIVVARERVAEFKKWLDR